jgi:hypothetical protein
MVSMVFYTATLYNVHMWYDSSFSKNSIATTHGREQGLVGTLHTTFAMFEGRRTLRLLFRQPLQCPNFNVLLSRHSLQA